MSSNAPNRPSAVLAPTKMKETMVTGQGKASQPNVPVATSSDVKLKHTVVPMSGPTIAAGFRSGMAKAAAENGGDEEQVDSDIDIAIAVLKNAGIELVPQQAEKIAKMKKDEEDASHAMAPNRKRGGMIMSKEEMAKARANKKGC